MQTANNIIPLHPTHPGMVIKDELEYSGVSQRQLAESTGLSLSTVNDILNARRALTPCHALLISEYMGLNADSLMAMQARYDLINARRDTSILKRLSNIRRIAAIF